MSNIPSTNPSANAQTNVTATKVPADANAPATKATTGAEASTSTAKATAAGNLSTASATMVPTNAPSAIQPPLTSNLPVLEEPKTMQLSGAALDALIQMIGNATTFIMFTNAATAIDSVSKQLKAENEKRAAEDKKASEAALKAQNQSFWSKLWGYVSKVATIIASVALTVVTAGAASVIAATMVAFAVAGLVKSIAQDAGAKWADNIPTSPGDLVSKGLVALGVDEKTAGFVSMGVDIAFAIAGLSAGGVGLYRALKNAQSTGQKVLNEARLVWANGISAGGSALAGGAQIGAGVQGLKVAQTNIEAQTAQANSKEIQADLTKLQSLFTQLTDEVDRIQQSMQNLIQVVSDILASQQQNSKQIAKRVA
jgi:hypothetical protein